MSYRTILVHVDQSAHAAARIALAASLARRHGAHLLGAAMLGVSRHVFPGGFAERSGTLSASYMNPLAATARQALDRFARIAQAHAVPYEARFVCDQADDGLARLARFADLVVLSQDDPDEALPDMAVQLPEYVILNGGRPVLLVPRSATAKPAAAGAAPPAAGAAVARTGPVPAVPRSATAAGAASAAAPDAAGASPGVAGARAGPVLVAWNGSRESAAALAAALPLLRDAPAVTLAALTGPDLEAGDFSAQRLDLSAYLQRHGVAARVLERPAAQDAGAQLLELAAELGCALLVMGCYGHTRLRELCLGGASRTVLAQATLPVLCVHS